MFSQSSQPKTYVGLGWIDIFSSSIFRCSLDTQTDLEIAVNIEWKQQVFSKLFCVRQTILPPTWSSSQMHNNCTRLVASLYR